jgi:epoxyqueuosine reductase
MASGRAEPDLESAEPDLESAEPDLESAEPDLESAEPDLERVLLDIGRKAGLCAVGVASADVFEETRADLEERRRQGLSGSMQFTYRNPERSTDPERIVAGARALVVGAWSYRSEEPTDPDHGPGCRDGEIRFLPTRAAGTVARYARMDHYRALRGALTPIADALRERGYRARVVCDDNALVDRAAAHRAGLGWFGKNSLLLIPGFGSWSVLGSVVTDAPLRPTSPETAASHGHGCGTCTRCIESCPTGAIVAPGVVDARRCLAWLLQASGSFPEEHRAALGGRIYGCDECQQVCPINRVADRRRPPPPADRAAQRWVDLVELLELPDDELMAVHGRWYIADRDPRYLRRNALVALGNVGDGNDPATERVLRRWSASEDELLAEHARWASERLGREDFAQNR